MDLEQAISFLLEQQAASDGRRAEAEARFNARMDKHAEFRMEAARRHAVEMAEIRLLLRRAFRATRVADRDERKRRNARLIDSLNHKNGNQ